VQDFLSNPKNVRLAQQYLKVLIAYIQVLGSFVTFKVTWPEALGACIAGISYITTFFKFDMMELPGLACIWHSYPYTSKTYVKLGTPIVGCFLLAIPVAAVWVARWRSRMVRRTKAYDVGKIVVNWSQRYEDTLDVFWVSRLKALYAGAPKTSSVFLTKVFLDTQNNFMFFLFLIYPGASLTVFENFICTKIADKTYLPASKYKEECP